MKIIIKVLQGGTSEISVNVFTRISDVKKIIEATMNISFFHQTLVFCGRTLSNSQTIGFYPQIKNGSTIHVLVTKPEEFEDALENFLIQYYTEEQTKELVAHCMKDTTEGLSSLTAEERKAIAREFEKQKDL